ncbi:fKBP-type peptidyl-prolyl cis-trans isomerase [Firmicutes bacterium CAG:95]|nr:fKBP-type peptidyl-prolyl cis-trans isomerase [Firmicutes bacterium CAG:95]
MHMHTGKTLIGFTDLHDIAEIQSGFHTVNGHIHCNRYDIHITGSFTVSKQSSFHTVCTCQNSKLGIGDAAASVIVRMNAQYHAITIFEVLMHIFHLCCKHMRHRILYRCRKIYNHLVFRSRLPYIQNGITYLQGIFHFRSVEALRAVFKGEASIGMICNIL